MQFEAVCHVTKLQMMYTLDLSLSLFTKREESEHLLLSSCSWTSHSFTNMPQQVSGMTIPIVILQKQETQAAV